MTTFVFRIDQESAPERSLRKYGRLDIEKLKSSGEFQNWLTRGERSQVEVTWQKIKENPSAPGRIVFTREE